MKSKARVRVRVSRLMTYLALMAAPILAACGTIQIDVQGPAGDTVESPDQPPEGVIAARESALAYLREQEAEAAPPANLVWEAAYAGPEGLVGAGAYRFWAEEWEIIISYPIVAPEAMIYTVGILNRASGFAWEGKVDAMGTVIAPAASPEPLRAVAWLGHIASLPEGADEDDILILKPEGTGSMSIEGADEEIEAQIALVRDGQGAMENVHLWGEVICGGAGQDDCRFVADRVHYGMPQAEPEPVEGWLGVIYERTGGPGSGGDDYFVLVGRFPVQYGIWAMDEGLREKMESQRDTGQVMRIWGKMLVGVPDWNGTQIQVDRFELVDDIAEPIPAPPTQAPSDSGWVTYTNQRYGYAFDYPPQAEISESGIHGYPSDEFGNPIDVLPEGVTTENIFEYLEKTYGREICVSVHVGLAYLNISAPANEGFRYATCGRTGVGVGDLIPKEETMIIDGKAATAKGFEFLAEQGDDRLVTHNETMVVTLPDGTRIEYGSVPREDATYQDYLMKGRDTILQIIQTYRSLD